MKSFILFALIFLAVNSQAQTSTIQANILFKGYPYLVNMTPDGDILEFVSGLPELLNTFGKDKNMEMPVALGKYSKPTAPALVEYISPLNTTVVGDSDAAMIAKVKEAENVQFKSTKKPEPQFKTVIIEEGSINSDSPNVIVSEDNGKSEVSKFNYDLKFQGFTARLTPVLINQLQDVAKDYKENTQKNIFIRSFITQGDTTNEQLAENRMIACKDLLETYGIDSSKISTSIEPYKSSNVGNVNITIE